MALIARRFAVRLTGSVLLAWVPPFPCVCPVSLGGCGCLDVSPLGPPPERSWGAAGRGRGKPGPPAWRCSAGPASRFLCPWGRPKAAASVSEPEPGPWPTRTAAGAPRAGHRPQGQDAERRPPCATPPPHSSRAYFIQAWEELTRLDCLMRERRQRKRGVSLGCSRATYCHRR